MSESTKNFSFSLPQFDITGWHENLNNNFQLLDMLLNNVIAIGGFRGLWQNSTLYKVGEVVVDAEDGSFYEVLIEHTTAAFTTFAQTRNASSVMMYIPKAFGLINHLPPTETIINESNVSQIIGNFTAIHTEPLATDAAEVTTRASRNVIRFTNLSRTRAVFQTTFPRHLPSGPVAVYIYWTSTETTGRAAFDVSFERQTTERSIDEDHWAPWEIVSTNAPSAAGIVKVSALIFDDPTSTDNIGAGDLYRLRVARNTNNEGEEGIEGDIDVLGVQVILLDTANNYDPIEDDDEFVIPNDPQEPGDPVDEPDPVGTTWTAATLPVETDLRVETVSWDAINQQFIIGAPNDMIATSPDGITWTPQTLPTTNMRITTLFTNAAGRTVALGDGTVDGESQLYSDDGGETWIIASTNSNRWQFDIATNDDNVWIAAGTNGRVVRSTNNGEQWNDVNHSTVIGTNHVRAIEHYNGRWVIGTIDGKLWYSDNNLTNVTAAATIDSNTVIAIVHNRINLWMAITENGFVFTSTDGVTWIQQASTTAGARSLAYINGAWWIGHDTGYIVKSYDNGVSWDWDNAYTPDGFIFEEDALYRFAYNPDGVVVAVGGRYAPDRGVVSYSLGGGSADFGLAEALIFTDNWNGSSITNPNYDHTNEWYGLVDAWNPVPLVNDPKDSGRLVGQIDVYKNTGHIIRTMVRGNTNQLDALVPGIRNVIPGKTYLYGFAILWPSNIYSVRDWDNELVWQYNKTHDGTVLKGGISSDEAGECLLAPNPPIAMHYGTKDGTKNNPVLTDPQLTLNVRGDSAECYRGFRDRSEHYNIHPNLSQGKVLWDIWYHFVVEIKWSIKHTDDVNDPEHGYLKLWVSENEGPYQQYVNDVGINMYNWHPDTNNQGPMFTFGIYKYNKWNDNNVLTDGNVTVDHRRHYQWGYRVVDKDAGGTFAQASTLFNK